MSVAGCSADVDSDTSAGAEGQLTAGSGTSGVCCDPLQEPPAGIEGTWCCGDGTWQYDVGSGDQQLSCSRNGGAGNVCSAPPPADGKRYIAYGDTCYAIDFVCKPGESYFNDSKGCGCATPVPQTGKKHYVAYGKTCMVILFECAPGKKYFGDDKGCGCEDP